MAQAAPATAWAGWTTDVGTKPEAPAGADGTDMASEAAVRQAAATSAVSPASPRLAPSCAARSRTEPLKKSQARAVAGTPSAANMAASSVASRLWRLRQALE
jgi:hypothetical protein